MKTEFQVYDTRIKGAVRGCESMMMQGNAQYVTQRLNRRSRAKSPRYIILRVDPNNLPVYGTDYDPADVVPEFG